MSDLLLDGLRAVISDSYPDAPGAHFAYVGLLPHRDPNRDFVQILEEVVDPQKRILLVTNDYEVNKQFESPVGQRTEVIGFAKFLSDLESSLTSEGWTSRTREETCARLPRDSFIVMDLDPSLPSDCALALLGLIQWAIGIEASHSMPILISSTAMHHDLVTDLVYMRDPSAQVPVTNLWDGMGYEHPPGAHIREPENDEAFFEAIYKDIDADPGKTRLIIFFGPCDLGDHLQHHLEPLMGSKLKFVEIGDWNDTFFVFEEIRSPPTDVTAVLLWVPPNITILPPCFSGYDSVHVILNGRWSESRTWHDGIDEVAQFERLVPSQHRWMQLWWAAQPGCGETSIWSRAQSLNDFLQGGFDDHHLIDCLQLGGFVASVYDAERWGVHPSRTLYNFVGLGHRVRTIEERLETQGILSRGRFALQGQEASIFRAILPVVAYDHCVALFVCLDADPVVRSVKIDLAVLLTQRRPLIEVKDDRILPDLRYTNGLFEKLMGCCMGFAKPLVANGPMWLILGIWNRFRYLSACGVQFRTARPQLEWDSTFASRLAVDRLYLSWLDSVRRDFRDAIGGVAHSSDEQEMKETFENGKEFDLGQQNEIQGHLFRAFMHHTSISQQSSQGFSATMEHCLLASQKTVARLPSSWEMGQAFATSSLLNVEGEQLPYLCINPGLMVDRRTIFSLDWALIPVDVVEDWMEANHPNGDLVDVLLTRSDGQREEVCEVVDEN